MKTTLLPVLALTFALATWSAPLALADSSSTTNNTPGAEGTEGKTPAGTTSDAPKKHHHHKKCCDKSKCDTNTAPSQ